MSDERCEQWRPSRLAISSITIWFMFRIFGSCISLSLVLVTVTSGDDSFSYVLWAVASSNSSCSPR